MTVQPEIRHTAAVSTFSQGGAQRELSELRSCVKGEVAVPSSPHGLYGRKAIFEEEEEEEEEKKKKKKKEEEEEEEGGGEEGGGG